MALIPNDFQNTRAPLGKSYGMALVDQLRTRLGHKTTETLVRALGDLSAAELKIHGGYAPKEYVRKWMNLSLGVDPLDHTSVFSYIDTTPFISVGGEVLTWFETSQDNLVKHTMRTPSGHRSKLETGERELFPVKSKLIADPDYEFLEESLVADPSGNLLMAVFGQMYRNDVARLLWLGDTEDGTLSPTLQIHDGLVKKLKDQSKYHVNRVDSDVLSKYKDDASKTFDALDELHDKIMEVEDGQYEDSPGFMYFCSRLFLSRYKRALRDRGSKTLESGVERLQHGSSRNSEDVNGIPIVAFPYFPNDILVAAPRKIFTFKTVKDMRIEHTKDINAQVHLFVMSLQHNCDIINDKPVFVLYDQGEESPY